MKIEDQVCSLELAKRLKELGVKQESYFFYEWYSDSAYRLADPYDRVHDSTTGAKEISAFTVAELGEMLPERLDEFRGKFIKFQKIRNEDDKKDHYFCYYAQCTGGYVYLERHEFSDQNEASARAKILIYLLENGIIKEKEDAPSQRKEGEQ